MPTNPVTVVDPSSDDTVDPRGLVDSGDNQVDPYSGQSAHATANDHELHSGSGGGDAVEDLTVPPRAETLIVIVQNATGNYSVTVDFDNTQISLQSSASTDLDTNRKVASDSNVKVTISDDSGAGNTVDYDILLV